MSVAKRSTLVLALAAIAALPGIATAGNRDPGVNQRQHHQHDRIAQGVHSGSLTQDEAKGLREEQRSIRHEERQYKSDGALTRDERKDLHQDLNAASRNVYNEKHDAEVR
jgi:hypothetical protein